VQRCKTYSSKKKIRYTKKASVKPPVALYTIPEEGSPEITYIKRSDNRGRHNLTVMKTPSPKKKKSILRFFNIFSSRKTKKNNPK
jgi:hypothetical protein